MKYRIEIAKYDGYLSHLFANNYGPTYFGQLQNGPDGRIYCNSNFLQTRHLHVIYKPNELGDACDFRQHEIPFPSVKKTMPYFPNYRLGPMDDSISDTLGIDNIPWCWWRYEQDTLNHLKFNFTDNSAYNVKEWHWNFGDGLTSPEINPIHTYLTNGIYNVCLIVKNEFGSDTLCRILQIGPMSNNNLEQIKITVYPNPANEYFIVNIPDYAPEYLLIRLYDMNGKILVKKRIIQGSNFIDIKGLEGGFYIITLYEGNQLVATRKLSKI